MTGHVELVVDGVLVRGPNGCVNVAHHACVQPDDERLGSGPGGRMVVAAEVGAWTPKCHRCDQALQVIGLAERDRGTERP